MHRSDIENSKLEIVGVEITARKKLLSPLLVKPPSVKPDYDKDTFEAITNFLSKLDAEGKEIYLMGDTNCDFKKPNEGPTKQLNQFTTSSNLSSK